MKISLRNDNVAGNGVTDAVAEKIEEYFHERRDARRRADAKEIAKLIRDMKNHDTSYLFSLKYCLSQGQAQTIISRLLREETDGPKTKRKKKSKPCASKDAEKKKKALLNRRRPQLRRIGYIGRGGRRE